MTTGKALVPRLRCDPANITEAHLRDYLLFVKFKKHWQPKTIRQAAVLPRQQVIDLIGLVRLRRYRTPVKLIHAFGRRLSVENTAAWTAEFPRTFAESRNCLRAQARVIWNRI